LKDAISSCMVSRKQLSSRRDCVFVHTAAYIISCGPCKC
jgi:hypothetical protein